MSRWSGEESRPPLDAWNYVMNVNLNSVFYSMKYKIPAILNAGGGAIVNVASVFSSKALPQRAAYTASKHGVIATPMVDAGGEEAVHIAKSIPLGRMGQPCEVAKVIAMCMSS
ncbi:SDR family NAD(P)-dependent oxidoreductase [Cohnella rhizosphaerae]|uniref:SDR family oxidoreductase n=1 Tax=Cohnella rhizosphaerae TaxID=1457232 RepID=A0A9X4KXS5_9BACL|nr:SDR family oxidoreductase [Cohnella rhizosphaerae]MDG0812825.1 SDR family oxidoreductase [Cohnella rhizosphaerae]